MSVRVLRDDWSAVRVGRQATLLQLRLSVRDRYDHQGTAQWKAPALCRCLTRGESSDGGNVVKRAAHSDRPLQCATGQSSQRTTPLSCRDWMEKS